MGTPKTVFYTGTFRHNRDAKGRLAVPARWRTKGVNGEPVEEEFLALPNSSEGCITVYPPRKAAKFMERIDQVDLTNPEEQRALMDLSVLMQAFSPDTQGRISLDEGLLEFAGIRDTKEVVLVGNVGTFSIWSKESFEKRFPESVLEQSQNLQRSIPKLGGL
jgi:MraZ protein